MTEAEWQLCTDPEAMLHFLRGRAIGRQFRRIACACARDEVSVRREIQADIAMENARLHEDAVVQAKVMRGLAIARQVQGG
jgi:hypothetical protein